MYYFCVNKKYFTQLYRHCLKFDIVMFLKGLVVLLIALLLLWFMKDRKHFSQDAVLGKRVLITGASSGIGEQLAYQYAQHGASVFITARREERLKQVIKKCKAIGDKKAKFGYFVADMTNYKTQSKKFVKAGVKQLGGIDTIVVNHVHVNSSSSVIYWMGTDSNLHEFEKHTDTNYKSYVYLVSEALPYLKKAATGRIGIVGSVCGKLPCTRSAMYSGVKFALDGFFASMRAELAEARSNISVTYGAIGGTDTELMSRGLEKAKSLKNDYLTKMAEEMKNSLESPESVAYEIMVATESGDAELYYPATTPTVLPIPFKWFTAIRIFFPNFTLFSLPVDVVDDIKKMQQI